MTSSRGHGAIVYCLNSGSDAIQTGSHNGDEGEEPFPRWRKRIKPCPGSRTGEESPVWNGLRESPGWRKLEESAKGIGVERKERR
ncbi:hypothetical protein TNCV_4987521 [Trichonephila clavipes]|nr:hypothetical protein TNCV_4987521 [Trichonephila clavipes]